MPEILQLLLAGGYKSKTGAAVTRTTAFRVGAFFACIRVLSEGVAQVPFKVMQQMPADLKVSRHAQRRDATDHPLYDLLHRKPNGWQSSFELREQIVTHCAVAGRAHLFKNVVDVGVRGPRVVELIALDPGRVTVTQNADWSLTYKVQGRNGESKTFTQDQIWTIRGPSWDGVLGHDVLSIAREALGLSISAEESQALIHQNGLQPSGVYSVEGPLNPEQQKQLSKWLKDQAADKHSPLILDRGAKWISQSISSLDAQHYETRQHQVVEVARFMRVLPIMIGHSDKTQTFASAEQMFLAHVVHTLMPWYERIQQSADINLLTDDERADGYYTKLVEAGLLRGAQKDTSEYLYRLTQAGVMERNEARGKLDLNPLAGLDEPLTPTNMTTDPGGAPAPQPGT